MAPAGFGGDRCNIPLNSQRKKKKDDRVWGVILSSLKTTHTAESKEEGKKKEVPIGARIHTSIRGPSRCQIYWMEGGVYINSEGG